MTQKIEVSKQTYSRLEKLAKGFDTPDAVITRLLDDAEGKSDTKPSITFTPSDEQEFKLRLIDSKLAEVVIFKKDGSREISHWNANRLTPSSNLRGNLWSGLLRGWKSKGITKVDLTILPTTSSSPDDDTAQLLALALEFQLTFDEISELSFEIDTNESNDGLVYNHIVQFDEGCNQEVLDKIEGLNENRWINIDNSVLG